MKKWITYQKERFPLVQYVPMMLTFSFCALSYSLHLYNKSGSLGDILNLKFVVSFVTSLTFLMLLRIADEHKDFEEDSLYRPYRPVQRGLVKLKELKVIGIAIVIIQIVLALILDPKLLFILSIIYIYFFLMSVEFFVPKWLKKQHTLYLLSHMLIIPLIDMYASACDWYVSGNVFSIGILVFMISSYCDGTVVEVGRKLRAKEDEEYGVDTYTQIWGPKKSMLVWMICMTVSFISTTIAGIHVNSGFEIFSILIFFYIYALFISIRFAKEPTSKNAKVFEIFPGIWMMVMYLLLGIIPFLK